MHAYDDKVVPDSQKFPHVLGWRLTLHHLCEQGHEKRWTVKAAVYALIL